MGTLFEDVRRHIEGQVAELHGEEDFLPIMAVRSHRGDLIICGLLMPDPTDTAAKNAVATSMSAICAVHRATEVAFTSLAWSVTGSGKAPTGDYSQHPDREEIVFITMVDATEKPATIYKASMVRENDLCGVGVWEQWGGGFGGGAGRFVKAIQLGMKMGRKIMEESMEVSEWMDQQIDDGKVEDLLNSMTRTFTMAQKLQAEARGGVQN